MTLALATSFAPLLCCLSSLLIRCLHQGIEFLRGFAFLQLFSSLTKPVYFLGRKLKPLALIKLQDQTFPEQLERLLGCRALMNELMAKA